MFFRQGILLGFRCSWLCFYPLTKHKSRRRISYFVSIKYNHYVMTLTINFIRLGNRSTHSSHKYSHLSNIPDGMYITHTFVWWFSTNKANKVKTWPAGKMTGIKYSYTTVSSYAMDFVGRDSQQRTMRFVDLSSKNHSFDSSVWKLTFLDK